MKRLVVSYGDLAELSLVQVRNLLNYGVRKNVQLHGILTFVLKNCEESILPHSIIQNLRVSTFAFEIVIVVSFKMFTRHIKVIGFILVS